MGSPWLRVDEVVGLSVGVAGTHTLVEYPRRGGGLGADDDDSCVWFGDADDGANDRARAHSGEDEVSLCSASGVEGGINSTLLLGSSPSVARSSRD
eukprot:6213935-Pleurochrysis_carterae.AAC.1